MSGDLEQLVDAVRQDTMDRPLAEPHALRGVADHRTRVRRGTTLVAAALVLSAAVAGGVALGRGPAHPSRLGGDPGASASASAVPSVPPSASPSASPAASPAGASGTGGLGAPARVPGDDCRPSDLAPPVIQTNGAMGSTIHDVYVRGVSAMSCRLTKFPVLLYTDPATGALRPVPVVGPTGPQQPVLLQPGGWVEFATRWRNYPADGSDPRCTRAVSYHGLWVELAGGLRYSLGTWTATTTCDDFQETGWRASGPPQPTS